MRDDILHRVAELDAFVPELALAADELETNPEAWRRVWAEPQMRAISFVGVPETVNPYPFSAAGMGADCGHAMHLALVERLSRGGATTMMALPASALSTRAVLRLGTNAQIMRFFAPFAKGEAWTFFGVTEKEAGSDAAQSQTALTPNGDGWTLSGRKMLVGGATLASRGLILAQDLHTRMLRLVIIGTPADGTYFSAAQMPTTGLAGAGISDLRFNDYPVAPEDILAIDSRRPVMMALSDVFEKHRPLVGAMALGTARAILDRLQDLGFQHGFQDLDLHHRALLKRMLRLGHQADAGPITIHEVSQFKWQATQLVDILRARLAANAPEAILQDPRSRRLWRDAGAFEYMEGTSGIHRLNAYRDYLTGDLAHDLAV